MLVNIHFKRDTDYDETIHTQFTRGPEMRLRIQNS